MKSGAVKILRYYCGKLNAAKISQKQRRLMRSRKKTKSLPISDQIGRFFCIVIPGKQRFHQEPLSIPTENPTRERVPPKIANSIITRYAKYDPTGHETR